MAIEFWAITEMIRTIPLNASVIETNGFIKFLPQLLETSANKLQ
jgi:hypothetical protein